MILFLLLFFRDSKYVALKVVSAESSEKSNELPVLRDIMQSADGRRHIIEMLDEFELRGPNGIHRCLVFEAMGPNANEMVEELPQFKPRMWGMVVRFPPPMAKSILRQALQALAVLHQKGIAHGDFHPGNLLFGLDERVHSKPEEEMKQQSASEPIVRLDGKQDKWAPRYICDAESLASFVNLDIAGGLKVKLSDLGEGTYTP